MATKNESILKMLGALSPLFVSIVLIAAQWGSVNTKMEVFEKSLTKVIDNVEKRDQRTAEAIEKTNGTLIKLQNDMAYIKGKMEETHR